MSSTKVAEVVHLTERLNPDELLELIVLLQARLQRHSGTKHDLSDFPVIDLGPWPEGLSLGREDMVESKKELLDI